MSSDIERRLRRLESHNGTVVNSVHRARFSSLLQEELKREGIPADHAIEGTTVIVDDPHYLGTMRAITRATSRLRDLEQLPAGFRLLETAVAMTGPPPQD